MSLSLFPLPFVEIAVCDIPFVVVGLMACCLPCILWFDMACCSSTIAAYLQYPSLYYSSPWFVMLASCDVSCILTIFVLLIIFIDYVKHMLCPDQPFSKSHLPCSRIQLRARSARAPANNDWATHSPTGNLWQVLAPHILRFRQTTVAWHKPVGFSVTICVCALPACVVNLPVCCICWPYVYEKQMMTVCRLCWSNMSTCMPNIRKDVWYRMPECLQALAQNKRPQATTSSSSIFGLP